MDPMLIVVGIVCAFFGSAALGGLIAESKRRRPTEGMMLGLLLGPIGVIVAAMLPNWTRPIVDQGSRSSFNSLVTYQDAKQRPGRSRP